VNRTPYVLLLKFLTPNLLYRRATIVKNHKIIMGFKLNGQRRLEHFAHPFPKFYRWKSAKFGIDFDHSL